MTGPSLNTVSNNQATHLILAVSHRRQLQPSPHDPTTRATHLVPARRIARLDLAIPGRAHGAGTNTAPAFPATQPLAPRCRDEHCPALAGHAARGDQPNRSHDQRPTPIGHRWAR